jgi:RNA polymerase sigma factor (sigma-70 family)
MDDREVVAAIAARDPAGVAVAYDKYAAGLYGYCHWLMRQSADAAEAMRDAFVIAAATLGDLREAPGLRPWLYAVARNECQRRLRMRPATRGEEADAASQRADAADQRADAASPRAGVSRDPGQAELRALVRGILAELTPSEREVIELNLRHDLYNADLATAIGVSWSRAYALSSRACGRLEKALGVLVIAHTGREACPTLDELLAGLDGQLTKQTRDLVGGHIEQCETCVGYKWGALRPVAVSGLLPLAPLPPGLREQVLRLCSGTTPDAVAYRRRVARRADSVWPAWFSRAIRLVRWDSIRGNPGAATATVVIVLWVVAAVTVTLLTFAGSHPARALAARPSVGTPASSPAAAMAASAPMTAPTSAAGRPSPTVSQPPAVVPPPVESSASPTKIAQPSPSHSAKPSQSPSPKPSQSPSPKPSQSPTPSPKSSRSPSPSTTG